MRLLLDTHVLLWAAAAPTKLSLAARRMLIDKANTPMFSVASVWEVAIKTGLGRADFKLEAGELRRGLLDNGYGEIPIAGAHAVAAASLPPIHKDPFDRMLVAQALVEGLTLITADPIVAKYPGAIRRI